jgi:hypothetical protein
MMENLPMGEGRGELFENRHFHLNATNFIPLDKSVQHVYLYHTVILLGTQSPIPVVSNGKSFWK